MVNLTVKYPLVLRVTLSLQTNKLERLKRVVWYSKLMRPFPKLLKTNYRTKKPKNKALENI